METRDLRELVEFSEQEPVHRIVFESERLWSELLCLDRAHRYGPVSDPRADGIFTVVAGEVSIQVGANRKRLRQWGAAFAPAAEFQSGNGRCSAVWNSACIHRVHHPSAVGTLH